MGLSGTSTTSAKSSLLTIPSVVVDLERPQASGQLSPTVSGHEGPFDEPGTARVPRPFRQQSGSRA